MDLFDYNIEHGDNKYIAVRDQESYRDIKQHVEELWCEFEPYADPHFRKEIADNFHSRYWEMYLGYTLLKSGFNLNTTNGIGPDFCIVTPDKYELYIEAVAVKYGEGPDAVPRPVCGGYNSEPQYTPTPEIVLRIRTAIEDKYKKWRDYQSKEIIKDCIPYIVAVNVGEIIYAVTNENPPLSAHACLGIGPIEGVIYEDGSVKTRFIPKPSILKKSGSGVQTTIFLDEEYCHISGLLLSDTNPFRLPHREHNAFEFLHNPYTKVATPRYWLGYGKEYWIDGKYLRSISHEKL